MNQIGNLAIICAARDDVSFQIFRGEVTVHAGQGPQRETLSASWNDNAKINDIIHELNFGRFRSGGKTG